MRKSLWTSVLALVLTLGAPLAVAAQDTSALARLIPQFSNIRNRGRALEVTLALSQAVPYRLRLVDGPIALQVELQDTSLAGTVLGEVLSTDTVTEASVDETAPGWSRLSLTLKRPHSIESAEMLVDAQSGAAILRVILRPTSRSEYAEIAEARPQVPPQPAAPHTRQLGERALTIVLDPGHGGFDPGAQNGGYSEAVLMLTFARELREKLIRAGNFEVVLTRNADQFVALPERVAIARRAGADAFISLHADALQEGRATGATVYTLSDEGSDEASALLADRLDRADLLAGVDLSGADDAVATVLMDMARTETRPRSEALAGHMVAEIDAALGGMHKRPRLKADFSVLRAPDIPSVLVELGFLTSDGDLANLLNPLWRDQAAEGILAALQNWTLDDAAAAALVRR
jgi:N-acetylmuramoyl-L-alanine amidase